ncbi:MAG: glycosyltransferase family 2 protein [Magnetococcales bacterium]|nr:glycosyltransferase family 2 protein [Magnetococcales bacterium]
MISVVSPFFNESLILEGSVRHMLANLESLPEEWEFIIVNDGSTDDSLVLANRLALEDARLRVVSYPVNQGRGYAIRQGVLVARGEVVVTTEIDSSWGDDIAHRLAAVLRGDPRVDMVVASPHLAGGRYVNVPFKRVFLSTTANLFFRTTISADLTMFTGMTRGYRREKFLALPLEENEKEIHLEIVSKALAFRYSIREIPAVLEWRDQKFSGLKKSRKSSAKLGKLVRTHTVFGLVTMPFRILFGASFIMSLVALLFLGFGLLRLWAEQPAFPFAVTGLILLLFAFIFFSVGSLSWQVREVQREIWALRVRLTKQSGEGDREPGSS